MAPGSSLYEKVDRLVMPPLLSPDDTGAMLRPPPESTAAAECAGLKVTIAAPKLSAMMMRDNTLRPVVTRESLF